jgi:hypothetical protein
LSQGGVLASKTYKCTDSYALNYKAMQSIKNNKILIFCSWYFGLDRSLRLEVEKILPIHPTQKIGQFLGQIFG